MKILLSLTTCCSMLRHPYNKSPLKASDGLRLSEFSRGNKRWKIRRTFHSSFSSTSSIRTDRTLNKNPSLLCSYLKLLNQSFAVLKFLQCEIVCVDTPLVASQQTSSRKEQIVERWLSRVTSWNSIDSSEKLATEMPLWLVFRQSERELDRKTERRQHIGRGYFFLVHILFSF